MKLSLPFFIVCSLVLVVALVAFFRISDFDPYSISKQDVGRFVNVEVRSQFQNEQRQRAHDGDAPLGVREHVGGRRLFGQSGDLRAAA